MLAARDITFAYKESEPILADLTWEFPYGSVSAVTGPSGRGKSTLLYVLGLLLTPQAGSVALDGENLSDWPDRRRSELRARRIGFVFQDAALDTSRTVIDNVTEGSLYAGIPRREARERARDLMQRFDVQLRSEHRPGEVSGGQAARVSLCRALVIYPDVILADEPTGNLDPASAQVVMEALEDAARQGAVVVIASHDPSVVARADITLDLGGA